MNILEQLIEKSKLKKGKIVLPEALIDARVMEAVEMIVDRNLSELVVFGKPENYSNKVVNSNLVTIIDIENFTEFENFANSLYELRKSKGMTIEQARETLKEPIYFACMLVKLGYADGIVAGAKYTTGDTLRPALQIIKAQPDKNLVAGSVLLLREEAPEVMLFADASLNEDPSAEQLVDIALGGAEFMETVIGVEPQVAFLSYSTMGSAKSHLVEKMQKAFALTKEKNTKYNIDGEMQFDCAVDVPTATKKGISSSVGGNANVFVFPDLNAGNISYKIAARLGGYTAVGPIMLNFNKPVNDLSRGCTSEEIVSTVCITKLQIKG